VRRTRGEAAHLELLIETCQPAPETFHAAAADAQATVRVVDIAEHIARARERGDGDSPRRGMAQPGGVEIGERGVGGPRRRLSVEVLFWL